MFKKHRKVPGNQKALGASDTRRGRERTGMLRAADSSLGEETRVAVPLLVSQKPRPFGPVMVVTPFLMEDVSYLYGVLLM